MSAWSLCDLVSRFEERVRSRCLGTSWLEEMARWRWRVGSRAPSLRYCSSSMLGSVWSEEKWKLKWFWQTQSDLKRNGIQMILANTNRFYWIGKYRQSEMVFKTQFCLIVSWTETELDPNEIKFLMVWQTYLDWPKRKYNSTGSSNTLLL